MLQNILTGFDILGVGVIIGSIALLWAFCKVLHDDLHFDRAALPSPEPETTRSAGHASSPRTPRPGLSAPIADPSRPDE